MSRKPFIVEEKAVSQVISVVLLVTITVVLAAVAGSAVLGLEEQAEAAPTADFVIDYNGTSDTVTIRHTGGQDVLADELYIRGESIDASDAGNWVDASGGDATGDIDGQPAVVSGDTATVSVSNEEYTVRVIWDSSSTDMTAELAVKSGGKS